MSRLTPVLSGIILALIGYAAVSMGDALIKRALQMDDMILIALYTNITTFICIVCLAPFFGGFKKLYVTKNVKLHALRGIFLFGVYITFLYAISKMPIAQTYALYLTQPFILVIMAHFITKEHIGFHRVISILVGFCGVLIVLRPGMVPLELAALSALLCALLFAASNMVVKFIHRDDSWMSYLFYTLIIQTPLIIGYLIWREMSFDALLPPLEETWMWIIGAGVIYVVALGAFPMALQRIDAALFGGLEYTVLFWGVIFGYFLFAEVPDIWTIAGSSVIVASGLYLVYREKQAKHSIKRLES